MKQEEKEINNQSSSQPDAANEQQAEATDQKEKAEATAEQTADSPADGAEKAEANTEKPEEKDPLAEANDKIAALKDQLLRTIAEFDNYKKRTLKEKAELILNGSEKTVKTVLPVLDDFERAMADKTDDPKAIKDGMELIFKKFTKALESLGVKKIDTTDKDFDVDYHEAIAMVPAGDDKKGKVIDCVQTGYMLNDKVIRHARVAVGQ